MGDNTIHYMGHVTMMGAVQPFISGAISKTVNMPEDVSVEDVEQLHIDAWKLGLKALAIYRNNSKVGQPLQSKKDSEKGVDEDVLVATRPVRKRLPKNRLGRTISFSIAGAEGYMTANAYEDGTLGEVFIKMSKQGSTLAGVMDAFSISISIGLQYGVPLEAFVSKYTNMRFEPAGMTDDADIRIAASVMDYLFRRLALDFLPYDSREALGIFTAEERAATVAAGYGSAAPAEEVDVEALAQGVPTEAAVHIDLPNVGSSTELLEALQGTQSDAPLCMTCGTKMRPAGSCYVCEGCGSTSGCS
jgi:ribonucleoside-diphosphate reductase alpha chain